MKNMYFYHTEIGEVGIAENGAAITDLFFGGLPAPKDASVKETALLSEAGRQLLDYFAGRRMVFELPLEAAGTPFQKSVWKALLEIPFGETRSYGETARRIGNQNAARAVGTAIHNNPIGIFIPCHRVIGANGKLVGFAGGLDIKEYLLDMEKRYLAQVI